MHFKSNAGISHAFEISDSKNRIQEVYYTILIRQTNLAMYINYTNRNYSILSIPDRKLWINFFEVTLSSSITSSKVSQNCNTS